MNPILLAKPQGGLRFFWNIDANVGAASPNIQDDVELIQFGYLLMSQAPAQPADLKAVLAQVKVGVPCTGSADDPLVKAIRAHQAAIGGTQDGHVSKIKTSSGVYLDPAGEHVFMLIRIVNNIFDATPNDFPRIDKHPKCPPALKASVLAAIVR